jgi:Ca-activated chloride channel family protein
MVAAGFKNEIEDKMKICCSILLACMFCLAANAQTKRYIKQGNRLYEAKKYKDAALAYQEALKKDPTNATGLYNLGNSLYQQKQYETARKVMDATAKTIKPKEGKAAVNYNVGNSYMAEQKWEEAIDAYKKALRNNPQDADAKYNLSYAEQMLKKQGGGGKNDKNKDNKDKKDQNKNSKDQQNQDKDKQDNKDKNDKGDKDKQQNDDKNNKEDKQDQHPQSQPSKLTEKQAEQLLNALQQEEKKLQDKMQKAKGVPVKVEKDW